MQNIISAHFLCTSTIICWKCYHKHTCAITTLVFNNYIYPVYFSLEYKIVVICSGDEEEKSYIIAKLKFCRRYYSSSLKNDSEYAEYLMYHFKKWPETATPNAASVDSEKYTCSHAFYY